VEGEKEIKSFQKKHKNFLLFLPTSIICLNYYISKPFSSILLPKKMSSSTENWKQFFQSGRLPWAAQAAKEEEARKSSKKDAARRKALARAARDAVGLAPIKPEFGSTRPG
jgi:hypothetical protein